MFFFRNKHIMIDLGTGNNNKINWPLEDKQVSLITEHSKNSHDFSFLLLIPPGNDRYSGDGLQRRKKGSRSGGIPKGLLYKVPLLNHEPPTTTVELCDIQWPPSDLQKDLSRCADANFHWFYI